MRKKKPGHIRFYLGDKEIHRCLLLEIPISEDVIIEKSILFFSDPEPCIIHRSAVRSRMIEEAFGAVSTENAELSDHAFITGLKKWVALDGFDRVIISK